MIYGLSVTKKPSLRQKMSLTNRSIKIPKIANPNKQNIKFPIPCSHFAPALILINKILNNNERKGRLYHILDHPGRPSQVQTPQPISFEHFTHILMKGLLLSLFVLLSVGFYAVYGHYEQGVHD